MRRRAGRGLRQEQIKERTALEEAELEEAKDLIVGERQAIEELDVGDEEVDAQGDPELGEEEVVVAGDGITKADTAQGVGIFLVAAGELNDLVRGNALIGPDLAAFLDSVAGPSPDARDHENTL